MCGHYCCLCRSWTEIDSSNLLKVHRIRTGSEREQVLNESKEMIMSLSIGRRKTIKALSKPDWTKLFKTEVVSDALDFGKSVNLKFGGSHKEVTWRQWVSASAINRSKPARHLQEYTPNINDIAPKTHEVCRPRG